MCTTRRDPIARQPRVMWDPRERTRGKCIAHLGCYGVMAWCPKRGRVGPSLSYGPSYGPMPRLRPSTFDNLGLIVARLHRLISRIAWFSVIR